LANRNEGRVVGDLRFWLRHGQRDRLWIAAAGALTFVSLDIVRDHYVGIGRFTRATKSWSEIRDDAGFYFQAGLVVFGLIYLFFPLRNSQAKACRDCGEPHSGAGNPLACPLCNGTLEPLDGFYRRHPHHAREK
jgi:hypothetical protein